jgi:hypothetical protein
MSSIWVMSSTAPTTVYALPTATHKAVSPSARRWGGLRSMYRLNAIDAPTKVDKITEVVRIVVIMLESFFFSAFLSADPVVLAP